MRKSNSLVAAILLMACVFVASSCSGGAERRFCRGQLESYADSTAVGQIVFVLQGENSEAAVTLYTRCGSRWKKALECSGFIGQNGVGKTREGDRKTPRGDYGILQAFGLKDDPGTALPYFKVEPWHYCCGDTVAYNRIIDIREVPHECKGEHLIKYDPAYNYSMFLDYNRECVYPLGSAIFFHCTSSDPYTGGCVAVPENEMREILLALQPGARVIIDKL